MTAREILYFTSPDCYPCIGLKPRLQSFCRAEDITLREVDITSRDPEMEALVLKHGIMSVPTLIIGTKTIFAGQARMANIKQKVVEEL